VTLKFGVVTFPGTCDDTDARAACARVGDVVQLWHAEHTLQDVDAVVVPGGFSYGDHLRVGAIARFSPVMTEIARFAEAGGPVLGICNGFQILCEAGLLPGALLPNTGLRFAMRQTSVQVQSTGCVWTSACAAGEVLSIPAKNVAGRYYASGPTLEEMESRGQVVLRYIADPLPNGSLDGIAGVCNAGGNIMGLMPHPEHAVDELIGGADGLKLFASAAGARV
jgi:phosphoribosylformylglycinamidine synthase